MKALKNLLIIIFLSFILQHVQTMSQQNTSPSVGLAVTTQVLPVPPAPTLLRPQNNSFVLFFPVWLVWRDSAIITSYHIQVGHDSNYVSSVLDTVLNTNLSLDSVSIPVSLLSWLRFYWHVSATNGSGTSSYSPSWNFLLPQVGINLVSGEVPKKFKLYDNYPNPFNPECTIRFDLPVSGVVNITIYNILGQETGVPINTHLEAGSYSFNWDGSGYSSGMYFYKIFAGNFTDVKKMVLVK